MFKDLQVSTLLVCMMYSLSPSLKKFSPHFSLALAMSLFHSCSDDSVDTAEKETLTTTVVEQENTPVSPVTSDFQFPVVYVEELDQVLIMRVPARQRAHLRRPVTGAATGWRGGAGHFLRISQAKPPPLANGAPS